MARYLNGLRPLDVLFRAGAMSRARRIGSEAQTAARAAERLNNRADIGAEPIDLMEDTCRTPGQ
jgi:hypothetical protein